MCIAFIRRYKCGYEESIQSTRCVACLTETKSTSSNSAQCVHSREIPVAEIAKDCGHCLLSTLDPERQLQHRRDSSRQQQRCEKSEEETHQDFIHALAMAYADSEARSNNNQAKAYTSIAAEALLKLNLADTIQAGEIQKSFETAIRKARQEVVRASKSSYSVDTNGSPMQTKQPASAKIHKSAKRRRAGNKQRGCGHKRIGIDNVCLHCEDLDRVREHLELTCRAARDVRNGRADRHMQGVGGCEGEYLGQIPDGAGNCEAS